MMCQSAEISSGNSFLLIMVTQMVNPEIVDRPGANYSQQDFGTAFSRSSRDETVYSLPL
jgi:hypothetical protein